MNTTWTLIANPVAGRGRNERAASDCAARLRLSGRDVTVRFTERRGHGAQLAAEAVSVGHGAVIVCGGDGTIAEVLPSLAHTSTALGLIPQGTGNDLARGLGIPRSPAAAVRLLRDGQARSIDLGRCGERWFSTVATFGFDAEVSQIMEEGRAPLSGTAGYLLASLRHMHHYRPPHVRLSGDFSESDQSVFLAAVANTRTYGGGLRIAPEASPDDGLFDVCIVDGTVSMSTLLSLMPRIFWGGHIHHPAVRVVRTQWVRFEPLDGQHLLHADGEPLAMAPATLRIEAQALRVIQPTVPSPVTTYRGPQT